jgi:hypothetical protein
MLHLAAAHLAARDGNVGDAETHLGEAEALARFTGERNFMRYHFGPSNVGAWELVVAVETDSGPTAAERLAPVIDLKTLGSPDRVAAVHFDLARAYAQAGGARDGEALRHIDKADRVAPVRMRQDPLARELIATGARCGRSRGRPGRRRGARRHGMATARARPGSVPAPAPPRPPSRPWRRSGSACSPSTSRACMGGAWAAGGGPGLPTGGRASSTPWPPPSAWRARAPVRRALRHLKERDRWRSDGGRLRPCAWW